MEELEFLSTDWPTVKHWLIIGGISLVTFLIFLFLARKSRTLLSRRLIKRMDDDLLANFLAGIFGSIVILIGLLVVFRIIGLTGVISGMLAGAGISAFIIGFALKDIGENFLAGIILAFKRPFRVGDIVDINGMRGQVLMLNLRDTQIKTADGKDVFIPNGIILKNPLVNFTIDGFLRYDFIVGLDYGSDYQAAIEVIKSIIVQVPGVLDSAKLPEVWVTEMAESTLNIQVSFWVNTFEREISDAVVKSSAILMVLTALEKGGFNMPARILELKNYQGKELKTSAADSL
ncbi:mechanosensitive ion channel family protein [Algoriphagus sp. C2-6-M1]|uniref:mechanosensitive ion channel family protein n=1 Tax=Algoriphagus persicinus TaxID=3108754 RepID=UPI002B3A3B4D|nr:mechanosensitive ion channel family protein [Algoriphagus sp. C2-6-M1]MEB2778869.1 mechanosensitive ion channel family protein [Algoriphagus sp. C2-6-M1]